MSLDVEDFEEHFDRSHPELAERMWEVADHLRQKCPVAHSDGRWTGSIDGFWLVTDYEDVVHVLQNWRNFTTDTERMAEFGVESILGNMPPMTTEPPIQRDFRQLLNPFLSPAAIGSYEPRIRSIVTELIDGFIEDEHCDLVRQFARVLPGRITLRVLLGIDDEHELERVLRWTDTHTYELDSPAMSDATASLERWLHDFVAARRSQRRRDDIVDAVIHGTVLGRPVTDEEAVGVIKNVVFGGFITQTHMIAAAMLALVENPDIQDRLRRNPEQIPRLFDEVLRMEPPVMFESRTCTRDLELGGQTIKAGEQVVIHLGAANRDPAEFDRPAELDIDRVRNRHLSFGAGPHRCVGSNLARLNMRIVFEESLSRMHDIRISAGDAPRRAPSTVVWGRSYLPLSFTPAPRHQGDPEPASGMPAGGSSTTREGAITRPGIFLTFSYPKSADDDEAYNKWYDEHHPREALLMPGFVKARRFRMAEEQLVPEFASEPGFWYVTIYEVDDIDLVPEMQRVFSRLPMVTTHLVSGLIAPGSVKAFMYEQISEIVEPTPIPEGVDLYGAEKTGTDEN